jgi:hypothetical protein
MPFMAFLLNLISLNLSTLAGFKGLAYLKSFAYSSYHFSYLLFFLSFFFFFFFLSLLISSLFSILHNLLYLLRFILSTQSSPSIFSINLLHYHLAHSCCSYHHQRLAPVLPVCGSKLLSRKAHGGRSPRPPSGRMA